MAGEGLNRRGLSQNDPDRQAGEPVQIAVESADLTSDLKRGLLIVRIDTAARKKQ
jgi:hypothetical protein